MPRRPPPPLWFSVLVAAALALAVRAFDAWLGSPGVSGDELAPVSLAFWGFVIGIVQAIWTGVQVAGKVTLTVLSWSVKALWLFATKVWDAAKAIGGAVGKLAGKTWEFLRHTYERVLKPAWTKFWRFVESAKKWLDKYVGPVLRFLDKVRRRLLELYTKWIGPILDTIGIARRVLQLLSRLGVEWARTLDQKLGAIEAWVDAQFRRVLGELNKVINLVNRVVTADGLFQRLALIRSLERDIRYVSRAFTNWRSKDLTEEDFKRLRGAASARTLEQVKADAREALETGGGRHRAVIAELVRIGAQNLTRE